MATSALKTIRLLVFPGGFNWPVWVGIERGFFARHGVRLEVSLTPGSVFQFTELIAGRVDMGITLIDNVIAYREGQGEAPIVGPDLFAFIASDTRVYPSLVTLPEIKRYEDLRGKTLSVDAKTTGYALMLYAMLDAGGLSRGDYSIESVGGVRQRYEAILERKHAGALFNSPFEGLLIQRGYTELDTALRVIGRYQGMVGATRRAWAEGNRASVLGFVRGFLEAVAWLYDPANRTEAFAIHGRNQPGSDVAAAQTAYDVLFSPDTGFPRDGQPDLEGIQNVIEMRARYGTPPIRSARTSDDYFDLGFLCEAK